MQRIPLTDYDAFTLLRHDIYSNFNCHRLGIIESFNPETQTASVNLIDKMISIVNDPVSSINPNSTYQSFDFPLLSDCPVIINAGSAGGLTIPINKGDTCILHFNDRDIDKWYSNGQIQPPNTMRLHDFSDGIVEIGPRSLANVMTTYNNSATELFYQNTRISLDAKIGISNATQNFKTLMDTFTDLMNQFATIVATIKVLNPNTGTYTLTIDPASITNLTNLESNISIFKNNFNSLFK